MKQAKASKEAIKIYGSIKDRLAELRVKLIKGNFNRATPFAYEIGFIADIDDCLKKLKIKRTPITQDNVQEIEMSDVEPLILKSQKSTTPKKAGHNKNLIQDCSNCDINNICNNQPYKNPKKCLDYKRQS